MKSKTRKVKHTRPVNYDKEEIRTLRIKQWDDQFPRIPGKFEASVGPCTKSAYKSPEVTLDLCNLYWRKVPKGWDFNKYWGNPVQHKMMGVTRKGKKAYNSRLNRWFLGDLHYEVVLDD